MSAAAAQLAGYGRCRIEICCNDPDNGLFDSRAAAITCYDLLELTANDLKGPSFHEVNDTIVLSGRHFAVHRSKAWFGNWCWNAYWMDVSTAVDLLAFVRRRRKFGNDMAEERLYALWRKPGEWDDHDREFLGRLLAKEELQQ